MWLCITSSGGSGPNKGIFLQWWSTLQHDQVCWSHQTVYHPNPRLPGKTEHGISYITHVGPCIDKQQNPSYWEHVGYINTAVILVVVLHLYIQITMNIQTYTAYSTIFILTPIPSQFDMLHVTKDSKISSIWILYLPHAVLWEWNKWWS